MGDIKPTPDTQSTDRLSLTVILSRSFLIGQMIALGGFGTVIVILLKLAPSTNVSLNPFAAYADVLPGQPREAVEAHEFNCWLRDYNYHESTETRCILMLTDAPFSSVEVVYANGIIHQTSFMLRDSTLNVGELAVMLDLADIQVRGSIYFTWHGYVGVAQRVHPSKRTSVLERVSQVTLTDTRLPKLKP